MADLPSKMCIMQARPQDFVLASLITIYSTATNLVVFIYDLLSSFMVSFMGLLTGPGIESSTSHMISECSTIELVPHPITGI